MRGWEEATKGNHAGASGTIPKALDSILWAAGRELQADASWKEKEPVGGQPQIYSQLLLVRSLLRTGQLIPPSSHPIPVSEPPGTALITAPLPAVGPGSCRTPLTSCGQAPV